jgi:hypothetical protein
MAPRYTELPCNITRYDLESLARDIEQELKSMAIVIVGRLISPTILNLFILPIMYWLWGQSKI